MILPGNQKSSCWLLRRLRRLGSAATVLHLGAHPDDEDSGLLTYISCKLSGQPVYWSANRGDSGQNSLNAYWGKALGVLRTWESLAAREIDGGACLFGPFIDFGYSKNKREAFAKWGRENMVREQVRAIRTVQPQVVVCRWTGTPEDFHGHHQAVGDAVQDAFNAAGDPQAFPELLQEDLAPWQPLKLYCSLDSGAHIKAADGGGGVYGRLRPHLEQDGILRLDTGEFDPLSGQTFQELAWLAYNQHKSQGMGFLPAPGDFFYYYRLVQSLVPTPRRETDFFDGLDPTLTGLLSGVGEQFADLQTVLEEIKGLIAQAVAGFLPVDPRPAAVPLLEALARLRSLRCSFSPKNYPPHYEQAAVVAVERKIRALEEVSAACLGIRLEAVCTRRRVTPGESFWMSSRIWNYQDAPIDNASFRVLVPQNWRVDEIDKFHNADYTRETLAMYEVFIGPEAELSSPYWLRESGSRYVYAWPEGIIPQQPFAPEPVQVECDLSINGHELTVRTPVLHRQAFPGGYRELPPAVIPPISLHPESIRKAFLTSAVERDLELEVTARCNDEERPAEGRLTLSTPAGWQVTPQHIDVCLPQGGGAQICKFLVSIPPGIPEGSYLLQYNIRCRDREYHDIMSPVRMGAPGLPDAANPATCIKEEFILEPAQLIVYLIDARFDQSRRYAYVEGAREDLLPILKPLGIKFHLLSDHHIAYGDLDSFDTIIVGPKAYTLRPVLRDNAARFLEFMENGGVLTVQYQWYGYDDGYCAPYPFEFSHPINRITDEKAPICLLNPEDRLWRYPNTISPEDFNGWVHDRGLGFFNNWDSRYRTYLSCADPGEPAQEGGLLGCPYGRGYYLYIGYSLFRQLPAGVPGTFRLFFNLLAAQPDGRQS